MLILFWRSVGQWTTGNILSLLSRDCPQHFLRWNCEFSSVNLKMGPVQAATLPGPTWVYNHQILRFWCWSIALILIYRLDFDLSPSFWSISSNNNKSNPATSHKSLTTNWHPVVCKTCLKWDQNVHSLHSWKNPELTIQYKEIASQTTCYMNKQQSQYALQQNYSFA